MTGSTPRNATTEADATSGYWSNSASNTLPPPDMTGPYMRFRPLPTAGVEKRRAHIIGSGIEKDLSEAKRWLQLAIDNTYELYSRVALTLYNANELDKY